MQLLSLPVSLMWTYCYRCLLTRTPQQISERNAACAYQRNDLLPRCTDDVKRQIRTPKNASLGLS